MRCTFGAINYNTVQKCYYAKYAMYKLVLSKQ